VRQIARRYGISLTDESLDVFTAPEDEQWAEGFTEVFAGKPIVALNRRTASGAKEYPRESWQAVVSALAPRAAMLEFGAPSEALAGAQCIWPFQPLRRTAALLRRVRCLVTVDSLAAHLATAVGTPAVVVFGPSNPAVFGHPGNRNVRRAPCEPCYNPFEAGCTEPVCLNQLPPQTIIDAALAELSRAPQVSRKAAGRAEGVCHVR
jgi:ADP-heptose:LPS heptosyltransferase